MGKVTRKRYSAEFKAKVALEAMKGEQTLAELGARHGIHQAMMASWKRQATDGLAGIFSGKPDDSKGLAGAMKLARNQTLISAKSRILEFTDVFIVFSAAAITHI